MDELLDALADWLEATADLNEKKKKCEYDTDYPYIEYGSHWEVDDEAHS